MLQLLLTACACLLPPPTLEAAPGDPTAQDPAKTAPATQQVWNDAEAKAAVKAFQKATGKKASMSARMQAVNALAVGHHKLLPKPLAKIVLRDPALTVRRAAAVALGKQPAKQARPEILKLLKNKNIAQQPQIAAELVAALNTCGYESSDWKVLDGMFDREFGKDYIRLQQELLKLITEHAEVQALEMLLNHIGEPEPDDVDAASNPPKEYWEARWKAWAVWRDDVKIAVFEITGQRFSTKQEARTWLRKNRDKVQKRHKKRKKDKKR